MRISVNKINKIINNKLFFAFLICVFCVGLTNISLAVEPDEILSDAGLEARARALSANLRCTVCQNESIDSSAASLAKDLRVLVRTRLLAGDSDQQVYDYIVARYGAYVLFSPPLNRATLALWAMPFVILLAGLGAVFIYLRRRVGQQVAPLTAREEKALAEIIKDAEK